MLVKQKGIFLEQFIFLKDAFLNIWIKQKIINIFVFLVYCFVLIIRAKQSIS